MLNISQQLQQIFTKPASWIISLISFFVMYVFSAIISNTASLKSIANSALFSTHDKWKISLQKIFAFAENFTVTSGVLTAILLVSFAIYISVVVYYIKSRRIQNQGIRRRATATSISGIIASFLGFGCAACGGTLIAALAGAGAAGFLSGLPLHGQEFTIIAIVLIWWAIWTLLRNLSRPLVCDIDA